jgi:hypothetical protein
MARVLLAEDAPNIASIIVATQPELIVLDSSLPDGDPFVLLGPLAERLPVVPAADAGRP